ncbi:MAG: YajQ family cyclic di-GMP-binding protein [Cytophagaceae bacterium]
MPSFDIVSKVDLQTLDNAVNVAIKEIKTRYDFRDSKTEVDLDKKNNIIKITTENDLRMKNVIDILITRMAKQGIDSKALDLSKEAYPSGPMMKLDLPVKTGIDKDTCKKIVKEIKESGLKVTPAQMDDLVRVTGKKIDDLQSVIALFRGKDMGVALQFVNMKS